MSYNIQTVQNGHLKTIIHYQATFQLDGHHRCMITLTQFSRTQLWTCSNTQEGLMKLLYEVFLNTSSRLWNMAWRNVIRPRLNVCVVKHKTPFRDGRRKHFMLYWLDCNLQAPLYLSHLNYMNIRVLIGYKFNLYTIRLCSFLHFPWVFCNFPRERTWQRKYIMFYRSTYLSFNCARVLECLYHGKYIVCLAYTYKYV